MVEVIVESELKITNIPWNDNMANPNSTEFIDMKEKLEDDMDEAFCNNTDTCYVVVIGFTEGSVNVIFKVIRIEQADSIPTEKEVLSSMQNSIISKGGIGDFVVNETSVVVCKYLLMYEIVITALILISL